MASWTPPAVLADLFEADVVAAATGLAARYNVAPTAEVFAVAATSAGRRLGTVSWGLVPSWSSGPHDGPRPINARAETLLDRPMFADAVRARRCLIPADGFYEWRKAGDGSRRPYFIAAPDGSPLAFAGLWDAWVSPGGGRFVTAAIVTTAANRPMSELHDRMPAILPRDAWDRWLGPPTEDVGPLLDLLRPAPDDSIVLRPANRRVGSVANDGPGLLEPDDEARTLF